MNEQTWQPIETAPKDNKPFLVYWRKSLMGNRSIDLVSGWREYEDILDCGEPDATHWHPLPAPPKEPA